MTSPPPFTATILIAEDDRNIRRMMRMLFEQDNHRVVEAENGAEALELFAQSRPDVILMDIDMPVLSGLDACTKLRKLPGGATVPLLFVTSFEDADSVERAFTAGATDYITKPIQWAVLRYRTLHLARISQAETRVASLQQFEQIQHYVSGREKEESLLVGDSAEFAGIRKLIQRAAAVNAPVLITGETGTGKNVVAKAIHYASESPHSPYISVNCAALPETLIEAELFGAEKGAYTGAVATRKGTFELAHGGTLFLDEIGEMPIALQSKLLTAIEERRIKRIGGETTRTVDVRIIAATNVNPEAAIRDGKLRSDLYYRLSVICIDIPPLRRRPEDIPRLCRYFIKQFAPHTELHLPDDEIGRLVAYPWPGNVRELRNVIERCIILRDGNVIRPSELLIGAPAPPVREPAHPVLPNGLSGPNGIVPLDEVERRYILDAFAKLNRNQTHTAKALNISLTTLKRKLREYAVD